MALFNIRGRSMLFNSLEFLIFFPVVTLLYFLLPHKYRWFHLLISSCVFYMAFIPAYLLILFATIIIDYIAGIIIENSQGPKRKMLLIVSLITNIGVLAIFKYYNFFIDNINALLHLAAPAAGNVPLLDIILPIGLSFHTFQAMSYTIEVYRGNQKAEKHFGIYALYVMFYPQLVAGPIERPQNMLHQFHEEHTFSYKNASAGLRLMLWGLFKKVVIADRLSEYTDPIFSHPHAFPPIMLVMGAFFFSFQIFCDFSGYSDMALGAARVMGFKLMVNFNKPYFSRTISEFWKRWHISLSTWFRDYLYISLGGNRVSIPRWYFNLFFVFLVSGFWHGANWTFIVWGALHGFYLVFAVVSEPAREKLAAMLGLKKFPRLYTFLQVFTTFLLVMVAWVFFRAATITDALYIIKQMPLAVVDVYNFALTGKLNVGADFAGATVWYFLLPVALIIVLEGVHWIDIKVNIFKWLDVQHQLTRWALYYAVVAAIFGLGVFVNRNFIYFQF